MASPFARSANHVLLYETAERPGGSQCLIGVGTVQRPVHVELISPPYESQGEEFEYAVPFRLQYEFPPEKRHLGVPKKVIEEEINRSIREARGALIRLSHDQFERLIKQLDERYALLDTQ